MEQRDKYAEKRQHKRAYIRFPVECRGKSYWQCVEAHDISAGGLFLITDKVEPPQTKLEIIFTFHKRLIHAEAQVVWSRSKPAKDESGDMQPAGMGIMFTRLIPIGSKDFIDDLVKMMEEKPNA